MPSLRERAEDVPLLVNYFLQMFNETFGRRAKPVSDGLMRVLEDYHWPGNIRELENLMKRYVVLGSEDAISGELKKRYEEPDILDLDYESDIPLKVLTKQAVMRLEKSIILRVLQANHWNRKKAARALHISYRALLYKLKEAGIPPLRSRPSEVEEIPVPFGDEPALAETV
jgi:DNA-binding NtrC family response regulator